MKTTERFDRAVKKLYTAFHEGTLNAFDCKHCAVGNIVGTDNWDGHIAERRDGMLVEIWSYDECIINLPIWCEYSGYELFQVEKLFLKAHMGRYDDADQSINKEQQFKGLCAVVEYLAELDGIPNPMDYTKLFEYNQEGAVYQL